MENSWIDNFGKNVLKVKFLKLLKYTLPEYVVKFNYFMI